nr:MAG TPA: hypothetical protein [Caudoviricetes sp.]
MEQKKECQKQNIIDMVIQIKREKYLDMIQGFVKKLWEIENESKTSVDKFID